MISSQLLASCRSIFGLGLLLIMTRLAPPAQAAPGDLDPSFGTGGKVTHDFGVLGGNGGRANAVKALPGGKILVAGQSAYGNASDFAVLRLNSDGTLDQSFGRGGKVLIPIGDGGDFAYGLAIDSRQRIVLGGHSEVDRLWEFSAVRLLADGTLDASFGNGGKVLFPVGSGIANAAAVAIDAQDRVILAGRGRTGTYPNEVNGFAVARLLENGDFDATFRGSGRDVISVLGGDDSAVGVVIGAQGKLILAGSASVTPGGYYQTAVIRLNLNGSLDNSFSGDGKAVFAVGKYSSGVRAITRDASNRILIAGSQDGDFMVMRIKPDGSLDSSFNADGIRTVDFGLSEVAQAIAVDHQNRVILSGNSNGVKCAAARLLDNGNLDKSFNVTGKVTIPVGDPGETLDAVACDGGDRVILAGYYTSVAPYGDFAVVRLKANGTTDPTFSQDGVRIAFFAGADRVIGVRRLGNGKIIVAGSTSNGVTDNFSVAQFNNDGSLDATFRSGGQAVLVARDATVLAMAVDSQQRIVISGITHGTGGESLIVIRLRPDGTRDLTFHGDGTFLLHLANLNSNPQTIRVDSSNHILISAAAGDTGFAMIRLTSDGYLDPSFNGSGIVISNPKLTSTITAMVLDAQHRILVATYPYSGTGSRLYRLTPVGSLDTTFAQDGAKVLASDSTLSPTALELDSLGRILLGATTHGDTTGPEILRLNLNGSDDTTFGQNGKFAFLFGGINSELKALKVRSDGRIVAAGTTGGISGINGYPGDFALAVIQPNGGLASEFGQGGVVSTDFYQADDDTAGLALSEDGRILLAGTIGHGVDGSYDFGLARFIGPTIETKQNAPSGPARSARVF